MIMKPAVWISICAVRVGLADETHAPGNKEGRNKLRPSRRRGHEPPYNTYLTATLRSKGRGSRWRCGGSSA